MIVYKDRCYCDNRNCENLMCSRNMKNIPWDELPEYRCVSVRSYAGKCDNYEPPKEDTP